MNAREDVGHYLAEQALDGPELTVAFLGEQLKDARDDADQATSRLAVVEQELAAAEAVITELRDNVVHMEGNDGNCLACCEPWTCSGYFADITRRADCSHPFGIETCQVCGEHLTGGTS